MDRLKKERKPLRAHVTRLVNECKALLRTEAPDADALQTNLLLLTTIVEDLRHLDERVKEQQLDDDAADEEMEAEFISVQKYQKEYMEMKVKIEKLTCPRISPPASEVYESMDSASVIAKKKAFKLPKISLKSFDGTLKDWLSWWSQFAKIHEDEDIDDGDKFYYLSQSILDGTEAKELINGYPHSADNYSKAVEALKERYGREDLQLQYYVRELLTLVITNVTKKEKLALSSLYLKLESHLRCLTTLKLDQADPATWLFPLVESSLGEDTLRAWQRSPTSSIDGSVLQPPKSRLNLLMEFIKGEVRTEQQISLAQSTFQSTSLDGNSQKQNEQKGRGSKQKRGSTDEVSTAAGLISGVVSCVFCEGKHESDRCIKAQSMPITERRTKVEAKKACFRCLRPGHTSKACKCVVKCIVCGSRHFPIMCQGRPQNEPKEVAHSENSPAYTSDHFANDYGGHHRPSAKAPIFNPTYKVDQVPKSSSSANQCSGDVLLNTLLVQVKGKNSLITVRLLGDTGSQRSYVRSETVRRLGCQQIGQEWIQNVLFGGVTTPPILSKRFAVPFINNENGTEDTFNLLERKEICGQLSRVPNGPWIGELRQNGITLTDVGNGCSDIDVLLGSDYWGSILTGRLIQLNCGLVAMETIFGWTLSGRIPAASSNLALSIVSMFCSNKDLSNLWNLETLGIRDSIEKKTKEEDEMEAVAHFNNTVSQDDGGNYVVALPWKCESPNLPTNRHVAERRLLRVTAQLKKAEKFEAYDKVFRDWEVEGFISRLSNDGDTGHYLPHRPVFKENSSTPVRPVYDASSKTKEGPSINDVMYTGPNLLELIPTLLIRFREKSIGISADIRKAFQMLKVTKEDQNFQKFLWWEDSTCSQVKVYQHHRVVFGMTCSPFLLASTINFHLSKLKDEEFAEKLRTSFYVDNCVCSVSTYEEYEQFREKAVTIMKDAGMDLRQWAPSLLDNVTELPAANSVSYDAEENDCLSLLGLLWDRREDALFCDVPYFDEEEKTTKRTILPYLARIFDPIGFTSPAILYLKLLLQEAVSLKCGWDTPLPQTLEKKFRTWGRAARFLKEVKLPRHFQLPLYSSRQVHVFVDGSSFAYAAVVLLRSEHCGNVSIQLLLAKSRLAPITHGSRKATIPRLELMGCLLGTRLATTVRESLDWERTPFHFWSDSTTALAWILRHDQWGTFVGNRVSEIRMSTDPSQWRHVPGVMNPADLPSRGCSPVQLLQCRWWEGPSWLYGDPSSWPNCEEDPDEEAISAEKRKSAVIIATHGLPEPRFSTFQKNVAVWGWVLRFIDCARAPKEERSILKDRFLHIDEMRKAERIILREIQQQSFPTPDKRIGGMMVLKDENSLLRVQTRLLHRQDKADFVRPIILPKSHPYVDMLIRDIHQFYGHAGTQFVISKLREKYWVLQTRRTVQRVLRKCVTCRRFQCQPGDVVPAPLPEERVTNSEPFETTGVDLAGPLILKDGTKAWIVLFTCAFYRCLYLDLVTSLSTEAFLGSLERFISLFGRPNTIFSDNGTNFHGAANVFKSLNWKKIEEESQVRQIRWVFNPPSAAWYGGFWERLVRSVKDLLKRMLKTARLTYDGLRTCLSRVTATINERPLTFVTEDNEDLIPLTPAMFLRLRADGIMPEMDNARTLQTRYRRMKDLQVQLQDRFRKEYLALLVQRGNEKKHRNLKVGDVVFVGDDNKKRFQWPLGCILELMPGRDGEFRVAKVKTARGVLLRPLQRLFPLEVSGAEEIVARFRSSTKAVPSENEAPQEKAVPTHSESVVSKAGRVIRKPSRYGQYFNF